MIRTGERGVALAEFAILLPLFMFLLLGLIEVGRLFYFTIQVGNAAHAGAQYASENQTNPNASAQAAAIADGSNTIDPAMSATATNVCSCWNPVTATGTAPSASTCTGACSSGYRVTYSQVTVTGRIHTLFNYGGLGIPSSWTISRTATMRVLL